MYLKTVLLSFGTQWGFYLKQSYFSGLGIRSFDFQANHSFFVKKRANERFTKKNLLIFGEQNEQCAHIAHFL